MWEESWEGYEQSRPPNPDLREARHSFGSHGPRSMTVVIVCTRSVVCPLERMPRLKTPALGDTGSRCTHKANPDNACEFLAGASVTWGVVLQPPPARTCCHQPPPPVRLPRPQRATRSTGLFLPDRPARLLFQRPFKTPTCTTKPPLTKSEGNGDFAHPTTS